MSYITDLNALLVANTRQLPEAVLYGENINTGSCISGLTRGLVPPPGGRVINVGNCEATHCGVGFGLMIEGVPSVLFAKQLDFMLLGIDHFVSTYNAVRHEPGQLPGAGFTIVAVVCDQGLQGPQSSFNALADICSLARVPGYTLTNRRQAELVLSSQLAAPGFRFITLSQRLWSTELIDIPYLPTTSADVLHHFAGDDLTIVSLNFSLPQALGLREELMAAGLTSDLFTASCVHPSSWDAVVASVGRTGRLLVLDDSKSIHSPGYELLEQAASAVPDSRRQLVMRQDVEFCVSPEDFIVSADLVRGQLAC